MYNCRLYLTYDGADSYRPKDIQKGEKYKVIGIEHAKKLEPFMKENKPIQKEVNRFNFFVIGEALKIVSIPDFNCNLYDDSETQKKDS